MGIPVEIPVVIAALLVLDVLAYFFGYDSREMGINEAQRRLRSVCQTMRRYWWTPEEQS